MKKQCARSGSVAAFYDRPLQPTRDQRSRSIHEYLSERSPRGALNVLTAIYAAVEFVRQHPAAAQSTNISDVRAKIVQRYRFKILYRVVEADNAIEIIHVRHTSRRLWAGGD